METQSYTAAGLPSFHGHMEITSFLKGLACVLINPYDEVLVCLLKQSLLQQYSLVFFQALNVIGSEHTLLFLRYY